MIQIPANADVTFNPTTLLEVSFPQAAADTVNVIAGVQLARNRSYSFLLLKMT